MAMRLYIATPINARKEGTFGEKYRAAKERIERLKNVLCSMGRFQGWEAVGGPDVCPPDMEENAARLRCIQTLLVCDAIYMDTGWEHSTGCRAELDAAGRYKIPIYTYDGTVIKFEE